MDFEIKIIHKASEQELITLYKDAGWWEKKYEENSDFLSSIVVNSSCFVGAFHEGEMVGMGRALSDMVSDAYIQDVAVLRRHRGKGVGTKIIKKLLSVLKEYKVDWIGLIGEPGTSSFYENLGFAKLKDHIPFKYMEIAK